jgi:hypothetical protein
MVKKQLWKICYNKFIKYLFIIEMEIKKKHLLTFLFSGLIIYTIIAFLLYSYNPFKLEENYDVPMNILLIIFGFVILSLFIFFQLKLNEFNDYKKLFKIIFSFILIFLLLLATIYLIIFLVQNPTMNVVFTVFTRLLEILIILFTLSFLYRLFSSSLLEIEKKYPNLGLFIYIVLYLPCLIGDFIDLLREQYKITSKTTWIIFFIQLLLIGLYILIPIFKNLYNKQFIPFVKNNFPSLYKNFFHSNYTILQDEPIYTNHEKILGTFQNLKGIENNDFNYNYGLYFDLWINPQPPNTNPAYSKDSNLMNYANKLIISYYNNNLQFKALNSNGNYDVVYKTKNFLYQSWNNIALNYYSGNVDIFINNELVSTLSGVIPYMRVDNVISGKNNGIYGGIKNIIYSDKPFTLRNIRQLSFTL